MYIGLHVKYPLFLSDFNKIWIFTSDFRKVLKYQIAWNSFQWEPSYFVRTDGLTDGYDEGKSLFAILRTLLKIKKKKIGENFSTDIVRILIANIGINNDVGCPSIEQSFQLSVPPFPFKFDFPRPFVVFEWRDDGHTNKIQANK
jgi:hypothetical protein